jgi:hypothetical protein
MLGRAGAGCQCDAEKVWQARMPTYEPFDVHQQHQLGASAVAKLLSKRDRAGRSPLFWALHSLAPACYDASQRQDNRGRVLVTAQARGRDAGHRASSGCAAQSAAAAGLRVSCCSVLALHAHQCRSGNGRRACGELLARSRRASGGHNPSQAPTTWLTKSSAHAGAACFQRRPARFWLP